MRTYSMGLQLKTLLKKIVGFFDSIERLIRRFKAILLVIFAVLLLGKLDDISRQISIIDTTAEVNIDLSNVESALGDIKNAIDWK